MKQIVKIQIVIILLALQFALGSIAAVLAQSPGASTAGKICKEVNPESNPDRFVLCELWKSHRKNLKDAAQVVRVDDPELHQVVCGENDETCSESQAFEQCKQRGFSALFYFTSSKPSESETTRGHRFTSLYCKI